ncbi:MAG: hypothetical protein AAFS10_19825, partial [Myxococcota bacterium]
MSTTHQTLVVFWLIGLGAAQLWTGCGDDSSDGDSDDSMTEVSNSTTPCDASPTCNGDEAGSPNPCETDEDDCREVSLCQQT